MAITSQGGVNFPSSVAQSWYPKIGTPNWYSKLVPQIGTPSWYPKLVPQIGTPKLVPQIWHPKIGNYPKLVPPKLVPQNWYPEIGTPTLVPKKMVPQNWYLTIGTQKLVPPNWYLNIGTPKLVPQIGTPVFQQFGLAEYVPWTRPGRAKMRPSQAPHVRLGLGWVSARASRGPLSACPPAKSSLGTRKL